MSEQFTAEEEKAARIASTRFDLRKSLRRYERALDSNDAARQRAHLREVIKATLAHIEATA